MKVVLESVVNEAARRYARRVWWADKEELVQEGWLAALQAQRTWSPNGKASFRWYVWRSVVVALRNHLLRESAPVKAGWHNLHKLKGLTRVGIATQAGKVGVQDTSKVKEWADPHISPEGQLAEAFRQTGTRREVLHKIHAGQHPNAVTAVLMAGRRVVEVAQEVGISPRSLQKACTAARQRIRKSRTAQVLLETA